MCTASSIAYDTNLSADLAAVFVYHINFAVLYTFSFVAFFSSLLSNTFPFSLLRLPLTPLQSFAHFHHHSFHVHSNLSLALLFLHFSPMPCTSTIYPTIITFVFPLCIFIPTAFIYSSIFLSISSLLSIGITIYTTIVYIYVECQIWHEAILALNESEYIARSLSPDGESRLVHGLPYMVTSMSLICCSCLVKP